MAWELLRTDYKDAVWDGLRKFTEVKNSDGTVSFRDVTTYLVYEDAFFGAMDANRINTAVNAIMAALENGTDLYEVFTQFFERQKSNFEATANERIGIFERYITVLEKDAGNDVEKLREDFSKKCETVYMYFVENMTTSYNKYLSELNSYLTALQDKGNGDMADIIRRMTEFETEQETLWNTWFNSVKNQMSGDVAANIILRLEDHEARLSALEEMVVNGEIIAPLATDDGNILTTESGDILEAFFYYATK